MITISLCMIVKNEERNLERCLESIAPYMDEIIIVDTGSVDTTKEIAGKYTDKIYDYKWNDDFASARNFSLGKATMDYIYVADADEMMDEENQKRFLQLKQVLLPEIDIVQMKYSNQLEYGTTYNYDVEYRPKLWKRVRSFQYVNAIHEILQIEPVVYDSEVEIIHKPHESHAKRDFHVFHQLIAAKERLSKHLVTMYAKELYIAGEDSDFLEAYTDFTSLLKDANRDQEELLDILCVLTRCARLSGQVKEFFTYALKNVVTTPCAEICYELGMFYLSDNDFDNAMVWFMNGATEASSRLNIKYEKQYPVEKIIELYMMCGQEEQANQWRQEIYTKK